MAALREHGRLNTTQLAEALGYVPLLVTPGKTNWCDACMKSHGDVVKRKINSQVIQPTLTSMERHDEVARYRKNTWDIYTWMLGAKAPPAVDLSEFEALL